MAKRAYSTGGSITILTSGIRKTVNRLDKLQNGMEKAINRTMYDVSRRAPGWVSKAVRKHYGVDKDAISEAKGSTKRGAFRIKVNGTPVDGMTIKYTGRPLTLLHFKMSPEMKPEGNEKYSVEATILKGSRVTMSNRVFLHTPKKMDKVLPFKRKAGIGRWPIDVVKTVSVPQMIDNRAHDDVYKNINEGTQGRFEHAIKQVLR